MGKGSKPRPFYISNKKLSSKWDRTFNKTIKLENPLNQEIWYCDNFNDTTSVDGIDYVRVYKKEMPQRSNLMRKSALNVVNS